MTADCGGWAEPVVSSPPSTYVPPANLEPLVRARASRQGWCPDEVLQALGLAPTVRPSRPRRPVSRPRLSPIVARAERVGLDDDDIAWMLERGYVQLVSVP